MSRRAVSLVAIAFLLNTIPVVAATNIKDLRAETAASRAAAREVAKERWEELKAAREAKWEEIKANIQAKREEAKANIQAMRDARKKLVVERVQERLNSVNGRRTDHFQRVLERLSTILDKIESRTGKAKTEGKNVTAVESAIASARVSISTAEAAVDAQKAKTYQITVTDDGTARGEVEAVVKSLHTDLKAVHDTVVAARQAVRSIFAQIKTIVGSSTGTTPTVTTSSVTE